ncbi:MAG: SDR family NAD(P)-dependent oxidoreductase [Alphaproteobacteria bacterium]|uniref:SDR family NAD(P)-dependent oxidoreductase n=1 Tax=Nisaea sp. TaxID=2024842 RepID=UPI0032643143
MDLHLTGKTVIISGATAGIGLATARGFLREGARVAITSRRAAALDQARETLAPNRDQDLLTITCDVSQPEDAAAAVSQAVDQFGALDCVIANAGASRYAAGWNVASSQWTEAFSANLSTGTNLMTASIPHLIRSKGSGVFISSIAGVEALPAPIPYSAAKAAVHSVAKALSDDLAKHQVRINVVCPGNVLFPGGNWDTKLNDPERKSDIETYIQNHVPLGRFGQPSEIAHAVLFLSSPCAGFITGACLVVDGGQTRGYV